MKIKQILRFAIVPALMFSLISFEAFQKDKNHENEGQHGKNKNKENEEEGDQKEHGEYRYNDQENEHNNRKNGHFKKEKNKEYEQEFEKDNQHQWKAEDKWDDGKWDTQRFDNRMEKIKNYKHPKWEKHLNYSNIDWLNGGNYYDARRPNNNKKVWLCHKPNGTNYPVNIQVSVNALQAHLNHGDSQGKCPEFDKTKYSNTYWETRNDYYNQYTSTTETLSFGQQLLLLAINKLTNAKTQLVTTQPTLSASALQSKQAAIIALQNNVFDLQNSLNNANQQIDTRYTVVY